MKSFSLKDADVFEKALEESSTTLYQAKRNTSIKNMLCITIY